MMQLVTFARTSHGSSARRAVMKSVVYVARSATTLLYVRPTPITLTDRMSWNTAKMALKSSRKAYPLGG